MTRPYRQTSGPNQMAVVSSRSSMTDWSTVGSVCLGSEIWGFPPSTVFSPPFPVGRPIPDDDDDYDSYGHLNICWLPLFYLLLDTMPTPTSEGKKKATFSDHIIMQAATGPVQGRPASGSPFLNSWKWLHADVCNRANLLPASQREKRKNSDFRMVNGVDPSNNVCMRGI